MPVKKVISGKVPVKIYTEDIDLAAYQQLSNIATLPFIQSHISAMPDLHCGIGSTL